MSRNAITCYLFTVKANGKTTVNIELEKDQAKEYAAKLLMSRGKGGCTLKFRGVWKTQGFAIFSYSVNPDGGRERKSDTIVHLRIPPEKFVKVATALVGAIAKDGKPKLTVLGELVAL